MNMILFYNTFLSLILFIYQPFTNDFERADIHELLAPDLLHQVIKGTFKDHLVAWVHNYLYATHSKSRADEILDDIDQRYVMHQIKPKEKLNVGFEELQLLHHSQVFVAFQKGAVSSNGQETTQRPS